MNKNLRDYVKVYKNHIPKELCEKTLSILQTIEFPIHQFHNEKDNIYTSYEKELSSYYGEIETTKELVNCTWKALHNYFIQDLALPWHSSWSGFTHPKLNKYNVNTQMAEHCDHIHTIFTGERRGIPVASVVGVFNDDYVGGEFVMFTDEVYELKQGDVIVFPSNFLYPHRVNEIIEGVRYSYASWSW